MNTKGKKPAEVAALDLLTDMENQLWRIDGAAQLANMVASADEMPDEVSHGMYLLAATIGDIHNQLERIHEAACNALKGESGEANNPPAPRSVVKLVET